jgi:xanthine/uracil permease
VLLALWLHVALGSVLRHALGVPLLAGVLIVFAYTLMVLGIVTRIFPPVVGS